MVGIVLVSHSARLVAGVKELAEQMVPGQVPLAITGGIDDLENPIGTDALKIFEAIQSVYSEDGVVVLMDLGSAILSTEMALEFMDPVDRENVSLSAAPFVEGALAAVIQAACGGTRQQVIAEAQGALASKLDHLQDTGAVADNSPAPNLETPAAEETIRLLIANRLGLHARPAAKFVTTANQFSSSIRVTKGAKTANAKSINQVTLLGVRQGQEIIVSASGPDAGIALDVLKNLVADNFGERDEEISPAKPERIATTKKAVDGILTGIASSPGIAIGPAFIYRPAIPAVIEVKSEDAAAEWIRLQEAIDLSQKEIKALHAQAVRQVGTADAAIFEAHLLFLQDPILAGAVKERIDTEHINAEAAWEKEIAATARQFRELEDPYMQARAADVEDVGRRVLRQLLGVEQPSLVFAQPSILLADDLTPSDTARLDPVSVLGICTISGGSTSHSAILARALGLPAIVGLGDALRAVAQEQTIAMDGEAGQVWLYPDSQQLAVLRHKRESWLARQREAQESSRKPAVTRDGRVLEIAANIGGPKDVSVALEFGAEGVGLFRTEFLFLDRTTAPSEEEQYTAYRQAADALGKRPLIIRTLDVGGDKPLPYIDLGVEENPFLGWRGIRICLDQPGLFIPQLRAILRASADRNVKIMFPMIGSLGEIRAAKALLAGVRADLDQEGIPYDRSMEIGVMIEVPSAVAIADQLAAEVDFFSIGTNDLTQYTMAADRGNVNVAGLAQALQPAVLRMVRQTVAAGHEAGIWIGVCGELAGNPLAAPVLVGLGVDELSMSAPSIPAVKEAIRRLNMTNAQAIAKSTLALDSAESVAEFLQAGQPEES